MATYEHLPIYKKTLDLTIHIEKIVMHFSRYHKYTLGSELRKMCHEALCTIVAANSLRDREQALLGLRLLLERIKIHLVLAKEVKAFNHPGSFGVATGLVVNISKQNEGGLKSVFASKHEKKR